MIGKAIDELIGFVPCFAEKNFGIFQARRFNRRVAIGTKNLACFIEQPLAGDHELWQIVPKALERARLNKRHSSPGEETQQESTTIPVWCYRLQAAPNRYGRLRYLALTRFRKRRSSSERDACPSRWIFSSNSSMRRSSDSRSSIWRCSFRAARRC